MDVLDLLGTDCSSHCAPPSWLIKASISSTRQAVVRSPSFTGLGYLPDLTPFKNDVRPIGSKAGVGGTAFGLPIICQSLKNPASGICFMDNVMLYTLNCC